MIIHSMHSLLKALPVVTLLMFGTPNETSNPSIKTESQDGEFTVEVARETKSVKITLQFIEPGKYSYAVVEKNLRSDGAFRQCAYIDLKKTSTGNIYEAVDKYPFSRFDDSYYRIRTVTLDQIERVYPCIMLPSGDPQHCSGNAQ